MRVAFAMINCNRRDGSARAVNEVVERLARRGHQVSLFAREAEDLDLSLVRWHRIPGPHWPEVADFWTYHQIVNRRLRNGEFDIIHSIGCNTLRANVVTIQNIQPAKEKILSRFQKAEAVSWPRRFTRWLYLRVTSRAERQLYQKKPGVRPPVFLPVSRGVEAELRAHYAIGEAVVRIVPNAADTGVFHPLPEHARRAWRLANGLGEKDVLAIFSGGEWARKGLDLAIQALERLPVPTLKLFVAGDDPDRNRFKAMTERAGLAGRVIFGGFRSDIAEAMASSDLFLFPSHYEAFSLATLEAAACGLPLVVSRINGAEDFVRPGWNGVFIGQDPEEIAGVLRPLVESAETRRVLGSHAVELVRQDYTWDRVTELTEAAYREAAS